MSDIKKEEHDQNYFLELMKNKQVCFSKWRWTSVLLQQGSTRSCFRTDEDRFDPDNLGDFHNRPLQLATRQAMLDGKWPGHGCEYCKSIEDSGGVSDRMIFNAGSDRSNVPIELLSNNKAIRVTPTLIEVSLNNTCNMSCIYCGPAYSSVWEAEENKYDHDRLHPKENLFSKRVYNHVLEQFFDWLDQNLKYLKDLHILGGEPTHQPDLYRLIELLNNHQDTKLNTLRIMTNLKLSGDRLKSLCTTLDSLIEKKSIQQIIISPSIDCWGQSQEYLRTGLNINDFETNLRYIAEHHQQIQLHTHGTITLLTIPTIVDLIKKIKDINNLRTINKITSGWSLVENFKFLHPIIMPVGFFDSYFDDILKNVPNQFTATKFNSYLNYINSIDADFEKLQQVILYLDKLDKRRNTNWRSAFPWFDEFVTQHVLLGKLKLNG